MSLNQPHAKFSFLYTKRSSTYPSKQVDDQRSLTKGPFRDARWRRRIRCAQTTYGHQPMVSHVNFAPILSRSTRRNSPAFIRAVIDSTVENDLSA